MNDLCVVVPSTRTQEIRKTLEELGFHDSSRRLKHFKTEKCVAVPVKTNKTEQELKDILSGTLSSWSLSAHFEIRHEELQRAKNLLIKTPETVLQELVKKFLESKSQRLTKELEKELPSHWEIHGDLALLPSTAFKSELWHSLGHELWQVVAESLSCKRLAQRDVVSRDGFRSPQVKLLLGDSGWVEQIDNRIRFTYDITKCMFSSGNISEKLRVASFDCTDEIVVDLYAGIGYFTLPYLVYTGVKHLHACEWNPDAVKALRKNLQLNNAEDRCTIHSGDNREVCPKGIADRVNLGLIPSCRDGWIPACAALRPDCGGTLHIHYNVNTRPHTRNPGESNETVEPDQMFRLEARCFERPAEEHSDYNIGNKNCLENVCNNFGENSSNFYSDGGGNVLEDEPSTHRTNQCTELTKTESKGPDIYTNCDNVAFEGQKLRSKWLSWAQGVALEIKSLLENMHRKQWKTDILHVEHVKSYAPYVDHVVLDLRCAPLIH